MTVADYTETPFARVPRLHHKDAAEGPSSAPFGRRNLVGLMGVMMSGAKAWTNPYVSNGLFGLWDAEWNAGGGKHDSNYHGLVDLSGNGIDMDSNQDYPATINDNSLEVAETTKQFSIASYFNVIIGNAGVHNNFSEYYDQLKNGYTIELCTFIPSTRGYTETHLFRVGYKGVYIGCSWNGRNIKLHTDSDTYGGVSSGSEFGDITSTTSGSDKINCLQATIDIDGSKSCFYHNGIKVGELAGACLGGNSYNRWSFTPFEVLAGDANYSGAGYKIHSARMYSRALSASEIAANYEVDKARFGL